jgi:serpin B
MKSLSALPLVLCLLAPLAVSGCAGGKKTDAAANGTPDDGVDEDAPDDGAADGGPTMGDADKVAKMPSPMRAAPSAIYSYATTDFAKRFHAGLAKDGENTAVSGPSAQLALSLLGLGADGETAKEFGDLFDRGVDYEDGAPLDEAWHIDNERAIVAWNDTRGAELAVANGLWVQEGFPIAEPYLKAASTHYGAEPSNQPFETDAEAAAETINGWVKDNTREKIEKLVEAADVKGASLVLTNAIAFKGKWETPFEEDGTRDAAFQAPSGEVMVPMMSGRREGLSYVEDDGWTAISLPYEQRGTAMILVLPDEGVALADVEAKLDEKQLNRATMSGRRTVDVTMPKWKSETSYELVPVLREMGLETALSGGDFTKITDEKLIISKAIQKVFVEVDEEGTEAAAATGIVMRTTAAGPPPVAFTADRPFLWVIWHTETKTPLFMGRMVDPSAGS